MKALMACGVHGAVLMTDLRLIADMAIASKDLLGLEVVNHPEEDSAMLCEILKLVNGLARPRKENWMQRAFEEASITHLYVRFTKETHFATIRSDEIGAAHLLEFNVYAAGARLSGDTRHRRTRVRVTDGPLAGEMMNVFMKVQKGSFNYVH